MRVSLSGHSTGGAGRFVGTKRLRSRSRRHDEGFRSTSQTLMPSAARCRDSPTSGNQGRWNASTASPAVRADPFCRRPRLAAKVAREASMASALRGPSEPSSATTTAPANGSRSRRGSRKSMANGVWTDGGSGLDRQPEDDHQHRGADKQAEGVGGYLAVVDAPCQAADVHCQSCTAVDDAVDQRLVHHLGKPPAHGVQGGYEAIVVQRVKIPSAGPSSRQGFMVALAESIQPAWW